MRSGTGRTDSLWMATAPPAPRVRSAPNRLDDPNHFP
jgi:hypothetical protein